MSEKNVTTETNKSKGQFIVLLGPDGSGKSTIADMIEKVLIEEGRQIRRFHWRPNFLPPLRRQGKNGQRVAAAPPTDFTYGYMTSIIRYLYYLADFVIGYWVVVRKDCSRGYVVIGERWYLDVIVHPERYAFRLPRWLLVLGGKLIPDPDITFLLEADATTIHNRKPELSVDQIATQLIEMSGVLPQYPRGVHISTDKSIEDTVNSVISEMGF